MAAREENPTLVFICYPREDELAAKNIFEGLRSAGINAWIDNEGLKGGDAWERKIRKLIETCTLFIPIISTTAISRDEGFYRREWQQATERRKGIADRVPFLVPVAIDDTSPGDAADCVPSEFLDAEWMHLRGGIVKNEFVSHILQLLAARAHARRARATDIKVPLETPSGLSHFSARLPVGQNDSTPVFGFVVTGVHSRRFLIRGIGPSLSRFGVLRALVDPVLLVHSGGGTAIAKNQGWGHQDPGMIAGIKVATERVGAFSVHPNTNDCALLVNLPPGAYSVLITSASKSDGIVLLEVYQLSEK